MGVRNIVESAWLEVFGPEADLSGDFLEIGGDSLRAARLAVRYRSQGFDIDLMNIFESRTVENQIVMLEKAAGIATAS